MPTLDEMPDDASIKMLYIGASGTGKTGSLASLVLAGYNLRILDFDKGGISILKNVLRYDPKTKVPRENAAELLKRVSYHSLIDEIRPINGFPTVVGRPQAFQDLSKKLADWNGDKSMPPFDKWTTKDVLVIDSLTAVGDAAMRYVMLQSGRLNQRSYQEDWGNAIARTEALIEMLTDPYIPCHVIIISHIKYVGGGEDDHRPVKGFPNALGQKLPETMGRFFNTLVMAETVGEGAGLQRKIFTRSQGKVELKTANPAKTKPEYELGSGLAELFKDILS